MDSIIGNVVLFYEAIHEIALAIFPSLERNELRSEVKYILVRSPGCSRIFLTNLKYLDVLKSVFKS